MSHSSSHEHHLPAALSSLDRLFDTDQGHHHHHDDDDFDVGVNGEDVATLLGEAHSQAQQAHVQPHSQAQASENYNNEHQNLVGTDHEGHDGLVPGDSATLVHDTAIVKLPDATSLTGVTDGVPNSRLTRLARRPDLSALEITSQALTAENERLRKIIAALESGAGNGTAVEGERETINLGMSVALGEGESLGMLSDGGMGNNAAVGLESSDDGLLPQHTLRELATAAVSEAALANFGFESLQQHLEQHHDEHRDDEVVTGQHVDSITREINAHSQAQSHPHSPALDLISPEFTASDFIQGLVTAVTNPPPPASSTLSDPFLVTRLALEADIAATRAAITEKEGEIEAVRNGGVYTGTEPLHRAEVNVQLAKVVSAVEAGRTKASVLRDMVLRVTQSLDDIRDDVTVKEVELAGLIVMESAVEDDDEARKALVEVRSHIEMLIKQWKEKGTLPAAPMPPLPLLAQAGVIPPPPSALPKKRGRPARSTQKASVLPPALAHLVPDPETVKAKEQDVELRRKGHKRSKVALEKEKMREEEEGELLRNLVGMGVWARDGSFVEGPAELADA